MARHAFNANFTKRRKRIKDKKVALFVEVEEGGRKYKALHPGELWAYYRQLSGHEKLISAQMRREEDMQFIVNYRDDYADWDAIRYKGVFYNITSVDDFEGYKKELVIYASTLSWQPDPKDIMEWCGES
jgi:SPP1 family predicted phage head-tail adaptor